MFSATPQIADIAKSFDSQDYVRMHFCAEVSAET
jgi:hypothetical protein